MKHAKIAFLLPLLSLLLSLPSQATMVRRMNLDEMAQAAGLIFRGTVVELDKGSITVGGRQIPTITYQVRIAEKLKGSFPAATGGTTMLTIRSVNVKAIELPKLAVGQEYLLLTTTPSSVGLSTIVGLSQGVFRVYENGSTELAVNALNNRGLAPGVKGPAPYGDLVERIRSSLSKKGARK
jgi:hypothetical protein